jgi:hypothetical protein
VKLSNLRHLVLQGCSRISNQCMAPIARLAKLHTLGIGECKKVCACVCIYMCDGACVCVCVGVGESVCVCVCVYVWV